MTDPREFRITPDMPGRIRRVGEALVADNAVVVGDVTLGKDANVWFGVTIRGDDAPITIGAGSNVQDNSVVHVDVDAPLHIGPGVTIGHGALVHGVEIGEHCLIGMGSIVLGGAKIGAYSVIGAGALVKENAVIPPRSLVVGLPGRVVRQISEEEMEGMRWRASHYVARAESYL